jgi:nicotinamidase-related amidase
LIVGSEDWKFHLDLKVNDRNLIIPKKHGNAFKDTNLDKDLEFHEIQNIVITGLVTDGCVRATTIAGHDLGFRVIL